MHIWIEGVSRSGKTELAIKHLQEQGLTLVLTVDSKTSCWLRERWLELGRGEAVIKSWQGFVEEQVFLFFPLLVESAGLAGKLPISLRVESEQRLARQVWAEELKGIQGNRDRIVRRLLDWYFLGVNSGKTIEETAEILRQGLPQPLPVDVVALLQKWCHFCWKNSLLTYGIMADLFSNYLLSCPEFQHYCQRFTQLWIAWADELPVIASQFCRTMMSAGVPTVITYSLSGEVRSGLGADAATWLNLKQNCQVIALAPPADSLEAQWGDTVRQVVFDPSFSYQGELPPFYLIETTTRAKLLRQVAEYIVHAITEGTIQPQGVGIVTPGLDSIARYVFTEIFGSRNIPIVLWDNQRPLNQSPQVRALLSLLALAYPHLGRLLSPTDVSEMFSILQPDIDPVRAGLLAENCFVPDTVQPRLLPSQTYAHWHRLSYRASTAYEDLRQWLEAQRPLPHPLILLDRAIQRFYQSQSLNPSQVLALRDLMETAQHYWEIHLRLSHVLGSDPQKMIEEFITELRQGIITSNPYPMNTPTGIAISNIYQYRLGRTQHRWQFWLDISSDFWQDAGSAILFGAPLFRSDEQTNNPTEFNRQYLNHILQDLLCRCTEKVYLCHSELNTAGQLQAGILEPLLDIAHSLRL
ncbi:MAG: hypothetical protein ACK4QL_01870 [Pseudanabaenaceae cyanobacterium]